MSEFVSAKPDALVERGFLTGRPLTIAGVRAVSTTFNGKLKDGSTRVGLHVFYTETGRDGEKRIVSGFPLWAAWGDQLQPSDNKRGFVPAPGATQPGIEKGSELGAYIVAAAAASCPSKLLGGDYGKWLGMVVTLTTKTMPDFKRKKSVDPDDKGAPSRPRTVEVPVEIHTLPADNDDFKRLTDKEIDKHLKDVEDRRDARKAAAGVGDDDAPVNAASTDEEDEEDEKPKKTRKTKKAAPPEDEDDEEEEEEDSFGGEDEEDEEAADEEEEEEDDEEEEEDPAAVLATTSILKVLKKKKLVTAAELLQQVHPLLTGTEKKIRAAVLKLVQSPKFIGAIEDVSIKGNKIKLG